MAVKTEYFMTRKDGVILNKTYSDEGRYVIRDGVAYDMAIDPAELNRQYTEGDIIPPEETDMTEIEEKAKAYDILMGVSE